MRVLGLGVLVWALAALVALVALAAPVSPAGAKPASRTAKPAKPVRGGAASRSAATKAGRTEAAGAKPGRPAASAARDGAARARTAPAGPDRALPAAARAAAPGARPQAKAARAAAAAARSRPAPLGSCTAALTARRVAWRPASRPGIADAVEITGPLGGARLSSPSGPLVIDCSLAVSLDEAGRYLRGLGITAATFSSAYSRRFVRGTHRPSKHSYGLAIDVQAFWGPKLGTLAVERDYEQGLGDDADCLGRPLTQGGATLKLLQCQLARSGLFHLVLSPDYDDAHHDHFHLEARPWADRAAVRAPTPAIY